LKGRRPDEDQAIRDQLEMRGEYEAVIDEIIQRLTINRFKRDFERSFQVPETIDNWRPSLLSDTFHLLHRFRWDHPMSIGLVSARQPILGNQDAQPLHV
jgi:hypothetical protein